MCLYQLSLFEKALILLIPSLLNQTLFNLSLIHRESIVNLEKMKKRQSVYDKALEINLDPSIYGVFAEIGAGQETANWFLEFRLLRVRLPKPFRLMT